MSPIPDLTVLFVALSASAGAGWYYGYIGEHKEVLVLENRLNEINAESTRLLNETKAHNAELTASQLIQNAEIEQKYHDQIKTNDSLHDQLVNAQRVRRQAANSTSDCNAVSKAGDSRASKANNRSAERDDEFSERLDRYLSEQAAKADKIDAERRLLINWIKTIPPEMVE
jgi:hypothetical protein